jgi:hypothetical protein
MLGIKFIASLLLISSLFTGGTASGCRSKATKPSSPEQPTPAGDIKVIAEGANSPVTTAFVAVIRDAETYAALRRAANNLPDVSEDTFKSNILIAAFLGERNTGGYSVEISRGANGEIRVAEKAPAKDMMTAQVITSPFKVVSLPVTGTTPLSVSEGPGFKQTAQLYRIDKGSFTISGGIAGRSEPYSLVGKLRVTRLGELVTVGFAVVSAGTSRERSLRDIATGTTKDNSFTIARMSHGSLVDPPSGDLHVNGRFVETNRLALDLDTGSVTVPDGFQGKGTIEAQMVAAGAN